MATPGRVATLTDGSSWRWEWRTSQPGKELPVTVTFDLRVHVEMTA